jgi:hypothetical protein
VRQNNLVLIAAAMFVLGACAASQPKEQPAVPGPTTIERVVASDVDTTWNALVSGLNGREFKINSLVEEDRTIRVLLQSASPSRYVDCGEISVRSRHPSLGNRDYNFPAANSARYLVADERADELVDVVRRTSLNALANVRLTPKGQETLVSIDARYVMQFKTREFGNNVATRSIDNSLNFSSLGRANLDEEIREGARTKTVTIECRPTGELERRIVSVVGLPAG